MKKTDISTIHETVLHGDLRFHLMVHEYASDPSRSERVTSHWHEEYELLYLTEGTGTAHVNGRSLPVSAGDILFFSSGEVHSISAPPGLPLTFYAVVFGLELISSYGNDDIQQKYIHRQTSGELLFQTFFSPGCTSLSRALLLSGSHPCSVSGGFFLSRTPHQSRTSPDLALSLPLSRHRSAPRLSKG